jgi:hypothetical protein
MQASDMSANLESKALRSFVAETLARPGKDYTD